MSTKPILLAPTLDIAVANQRAASMSQIAQMNANLLTNYGYAVAAYEANMASGQQVTPERRIAPVAPMAYELSKPDTAGFQYPVQGSTPIADQEPDAIYRGGLPAHDQLPQGVFAIGGPMVGAPGFFSCLWDDTEPAGYKKTLPGPDGNLITVQKFKSPWGGHYELVG